MHFGSALMLTCDLVSQTKLMRRFFGRWKGSRISAREIQEQTADSYSGTLRSLGRATEDAALSFAETVVELSSNEVKAEPWELELIERRLSELATDDPVFLHARIAALVGMERHEDALSLIETLESTMESGSTANRFGSGRIIFV